MTKKTDRGIPIVARLPDADLPPAVLHDLVIAVEELVSVLANNHERPEDVIKVGGKRAKAILATLERLRDRLRPDPHIPSPTTRK